MMKLYRKVWLVGLSLVWATLLIQVMLATPPARAAGPWYVGPGGSDGATCLSPATRCASINGALAKAGFEAGDTIRVAVGTYTGSGEEVVVLNKDATLSGGWNSDFTTQSGMSTIDGQGARRGVTVNSGVTAVIERFIVQNGMIGIGSPGGEGGGVYNNGTLTVDNSTVSNNIATGNEGRGGGIYNENNSTLTVNNSIIGSNTADGGQGGGIYNSDTGTITINSSDVSGNMSDRDGGGILNYGILALEKSTVSGNTTTGWGGGILNSGSLTLNNSIVNSNEASSTSGGAGGGIWNGGTLILNTSSIKSNLSGGAGGGVSNQGSVIFNNSAVNNNTARIAGGGIIISDYGILTLNNSTVSGNTTSDSSGGSGGGISSSGTVTLNNITVSGNSTSGTVVSSGGGIHILFGTVSLQNSIVSGNIAPNAGPDCSGTISSAGYNIIGNTSNCNFTPTTGDLINIDPRLGPLEGSPGYHPLLLGSPAINAGNPAGCMGSTGLLTTDQRGMPRDERCDIGAYEYDGVIIQTFLPLIFRNYCPDFFDDFSNPASGWEVVEDSFVRSEYLNGEYRILSKRSGYFFFFRAPTCKRQNYIVETDARWVGTPGNSYGLIFGIVDSAGTFFNQYYLFDINTDFRQFRLLRRNADGGFTTIVPVTSAPAINGGIGSNHLKVTRNGNQITLEVNGTVLGTWSDGMITGLTGVAIMSGPYSNNPTSDARFDNFSVTSLPGSSATTLGLNGAAIAGDNLRTPGSDRIPVSADLDWQPPGNDVESASK